jgi:hypothetical protein
VGDEVEVEAEVVVVGVIVGGVVVEEGGGGRDGMVEAMQYQVYQPSTK